MRLSRKQRNILSLIGFVVVAGLWFWNQGGSGDDGGTPADRASQSARNQTDQPRGDRASESENSHGTGQGIDEESGLAWIDEDQLPGEAQETLDLIDDGGPYPYDRDGITFENREGILPDQQRGHYREYTVPTPGEDDRGARRIVTGDEDEFYWTADHYSSFERIRR